MPVIGSGCNLTINGNGATIQRADTATNFRIFFVNQGQLTLNQLTISNGSLGTTYAASGGAGILNIGGLVNLNEVIIESNRLIVVDPPSPRYGAGIYSKTLGLLNISNSRIHNNHHHAGSGGGIRIFAGTTIVSGTTISSNSALYNGGGIDFTSGVASLNIQSSKVINNISGLGGGGIWISSGTVTISTTELSNNSAGGAYSGGAIAALTSNPVTISHSCITGNSDIAVYTNTSVDAQYNWWGAANGPSTNGNGGIGGGDSISAGVIYGIPLDTPAGICDFCLTEQAPLISPSAYTGTSQEAQDMLTIADATGLFLHDGPTLNARKIATIPWGTRVGIDRWIEFEQTSPTNDQLWYRVVEVALNGWLYKFNSDTQSWIPDNNPILNEMKDIWVNARIEDFYYILGVDATTNSCSNVSPIGATETLTFTYDREAAARYAIAHSYENNQNSPVRPINYLRVSRRLVANDLPFANLTYVDLGNGTGSAMFTSESIWMGAMPQSKGIADSCNFGVGTAEAGWRLCSTTSSSNLNSSPTWDTHEGVLSYYTTGRPSNIGYFSDNSIILSQKGFLITPNNLERTDRIILADVGEFLEFEYPSDNSDVRVLDPIGITGFAQTHLSNTITRGDYLFINTTNPSTHGLLVVGWGPPETCRTAVTSMAFSTNNLTPSSVGTDVPYVADFTGAQQPVPRPFYCTNWDQNPDTYVNFTEHSWFFFVMPDTVTIPVSELYVDETLSWEAEDGLIE